MADFCLPTLGRPERRARVLFTAGAFWSRFPLLGRLSNRGMWLERTDRTTASYKARPPLVWYSSSIAGDSRPVSLPSLMSPWFMATWSTAASARDPGADCSPLGVDLRFRAAVGAWVCGDAIPRFPSAVIVGAVWTRQSPGPFPLRSWSLWELWEGSVPVIRALRMWQGKG